MTREVFRLTPPLILWWVWIVFAVANIADFAIQGAPVRFAIMVSAVLAAVTGLAYTLALRPRVIADQAGLTIVNPFRDHHVPWTAIQAVDTGEWVRVHCASNVISCWALYISARTKRRATRVASSRLPEEARYLASLPAAKAIAVRLNSRASRERARARPAGAAADGAADAQARAAAGQAAAVTARWAWSPAVAVALPALMLIIVAILL